MPPNAGHYFPCQRIHCRIKCELDHSVMEFLNLTVKMCVVLSHSGPRHEDSQIPRKAHGLIIIPHLEPSTEFMLWF